MKLTKFGRLEEFVPVQKSEQEQIVEAKHSVDENDEDTKEQIRAFAHTQLAKSHPHVHKKLKNYD
jgi:hypothetical protein